MPSRQLKNADELLDLEPIKRRVEAATIGPWCWVFAGEKSNVTCIGIGVDVDGNSLTGQVGERDDVVDVVFYLGDSDGYADSEFIAHARTDIPLLIAEVERLRGQRGIQNADD